MATVAFGAMHAQAVALAKPIQHLVLQMSVLALSAHQAGGRQSREHQHVHRVLLEPIETQTILTAASHAIQKVNTVHLVRRFRMRRVGTSRSKWSQSLVVRQRLCCPAFHFRTHVWGHVHQKCELQL